MDDQVRSSAVDIHDLRHHLSLLALDLRLSREGLGEATDPAAALLALIDRLDGGLRALGGLLRGENADDKAATRPDRAELVTSIWNRFVHAGRLDEARGTMACASPLYWPGAERHWHSLLVNLLENATKAAPDGPVALRADAEGLRVSNGGELPSESVVDSLRHEHAPASNPETGRGRGLGLILDSAAALGLSVELEVDRELGRCHFHLRRGHADAPRLLLVEDDPDLRAMLSEYLRVEGFRVDAREDGQGPPPEPGRYVAAVADLGLPGLSGDKLLAAWRKADPRLLTVLLTGTGEAAARRWPGVDAVLIKPGLGELRDVLAPLAEMGRRA